MKGVFSAGWHVQGLGPAAKCLPSRCSHALRGVTPEGLENPEGTGMRPTESLALHVYVKHELVAFGHVLQGAYQKCPGSKARA